MYYIMYIQYNYTNEPYLNIYNISQYHGKKISFNQKDNILAIICFLLLTLIFIWFLCYKHFEKT